MAFSAIWRKNGSTAVYQTGILPKTGLPDCKHSAHKTTVYGRCKNSLKTNAHTFPPLHCNTGTAITGNQKANILAKSVLTNFTENERQNNDFDEDDESSK
ncbi:hypothetical protein TNCV_4976581 [Trichonephila clavipes]|nr:hypothetical protein TNCV_4976581 [Trichonephila clavipes]